MRRRVVITGLGAISPIGNDPNTLWENIKNNNCGIDLISFFDTSDFKVKVAAEVKNLEAEKYFEKRDLKFNDRFTQFARIAAKQAIIDANITNEYPSDRFGVIVGSGIGGIASIETAKDNLDNRGASRVSPYFIPMSLINLATGNIAIDLNAQGICYATVTACAAGTNAIGEAFQKIRNNEIDIAVAGGSEAAITPLAIAGFQSMRALYMGDDIKRASIPFDKERSGFVMGEGAGMLVLEELTSALARNAKIYGEIVGYGTSCDAYHITSCKEDGTISSLAMIKAMDDAKVVPEQIDYINAHGTSTNLNDKTEIKAIKLAFKDASKEVMISSTKGNTGHLLGASGAIESIICIQALNANIVPATINHVVDDPECDLNIVKNQNLAKELHYVMNNSLGFGGHNASLIFKKWEGQ